MLREYDESEQDSPLTPALQVTYSDFKLLAKTEIYYLFEAKSLRAPNPIHTIRVLNSDSEFVKENLEIAISIFIKEMLNIMTIDPKSVIINSFEVSNGGRRMAFAALPYAPLSYELEQRKELVDAEESKEKTEPETPFSKLSEVKNMIADVFLDVEFLFREFKSNDCSPILTPESIYRFKESGAYFLGDWVTALLNEDRQNYNSALSTWGSIPSSEFSNEMLGIGLSLLQLNGVEKETLSIIRNAIKEENNALLGILIKGAISDLPKELRDFLERMLNKNSIMRPKFSEFSEYESKRKLKTKNKMDVNPHSWSLEKKKGDNNEQLEFLILNVIKRRTDITDLNLSDYKIGNKGIEILQKLDACIDVTKLKLNNSGVGTEGVAALSKNISWANLTVLSLDNNEIGTEGAAALSRNTSWTNLKVLGLDNNEIDAEGAAALSKNTSWINLTKLDLDNNKIGAEGAAALSKNTSWTNLAELGLNNNEIGAEEAAALSKNTSWTNLTQLDLDNNKIDAEGAAALSKNTSWINLTKLDLDNNEIGTEGAAALSKNTSWINIKVLCLDNNEIDAEGAAALSKNTSWTNLTQLDLDNNKIGAEGAAALSKNTSWTHLTVLDLDNNEIGTEGAAALSKNTSWTNLTQLYLNNNKIGAEGAAALSKNISWTNLAELGLDNNKIGAEGAAALSKNTSWNNLAQMYLGNNKIGAEGLRVLKIRWLNLSIAQ